MFRRVNLQCQEWRSRCWARNSGKEQGWAANQVSGKEAGEDQATEKMSGVFLGAGHELSGRGPRDGGGSGQILRPVQPGVLMARVARQVREKRVLTLIGRFLRAGRMQNGICVRREAGTPQGGPLSPLLANVLLDDLDKEREAGRAQILPIR